MKKLFIAILSTGKLVVLSGNTTFEKVAIPLWDTGKALTYFETIIADNNYGIGEGKIKLDAVCASNDSTALGVTKALKNSGCFTTENFPIITGQDCGIINVNNIVDGTQSMSVFQDLCILPAWVVEMTLQALNGETVKVNGSVNNDMIDVPTYFFEFSIVTKDNYWEILVESGCYPPSVFYPPINDFV